MSVFKEGERYTYEFWFSNARHRKRGFLRKGDAEDAERSLRITLQRRSAGLDVSTSAATAPRFSEWAGAYMEHVTQQHALGQIKRPERILEQLTVVLRFWGARPSERDTTREDEDAPFHDLRLDDPIRDPTWFRKWETWVVARGVANNTRNHYTSTLSRLYWFALLAENRPDTGIEFNPFESRPRPAGRRRTVTLTPSDVAAILKQASYHVRVALTIGALALALRLRNILELRFDEHIDPDCTTITVWRHKGDKARGGSPLVVSISAQLRRVLKDAQARSRSGYVVEYRGASIDGLRGGLAAACDAAGIPYGLASGVTFHTIRHSIVTWLGKAKVSMKHVQHATQHAQMSSVAWYMHLAGEDARETLETVSAMLPIAEITMQPWKRASRKKALAD